MSSAAVGRDVAASRALTPGLDQGRSSSRAFVDQLARGRRAVRWVTVRRVLLTWLATPLVCGAAGAAVTALLRAT